jgi:sensor histidine kinase YesM
MKLHINKGRIILYTWIGVANSAFWMIGDLIREPETFPQRMVNNVWLISYLIVINFILFEYTIPFIKLNWKRILLSPFLLFAQFLLYALGLYGWRYLGIQLGIYSQFITHASIEKGITYHLPYSIFSILFFGIIKYTYDFRQLKEAAQKLRIEKQEAELNYLKSQTNPHFLFNTLNNIYSLARDKSDLAPESILRLSKILRFMLYEAGGTYIAIEQELKIINDYIELEKLRYDESLHITFNYDIEDLKQALPPLLLIPIIENAFKHGVSETRNEPFVDIHLSIKNRQLALTVKNSTEDLPKERSIKESIGLSNLRRQLQLLYTDYELEVQQADFTFTTRLKINLGSHV